MDVFLKKVFDLGGFAESKPANRDDLSSSGTSSVISQDCHDDDGDSFMRTTKPTWLENYWKAIENGREFPWSRKPCRKKVLAEIGSISLQDFVREESERRDEFTTVFRQVNGLGIQWYVGESSRVLVCRFLNVAGNIAAAQAGQVIEPGDELIRVNGRELKRLDDLNIMQLVQSLDQLAKTEVHLTFRYTDADDVDVLDMKEEERKAGYSKDSKARKKPRSNSQLVDTIRSNIRCRHAYPSAALISCMGDETDPARLADDVYSYMPAYIHSQHSSFYLNQPYALIKPPVWLNWQCHAVVTAPQPFSINAMDELVHTLDIALSAYHPPESCSSSNRAVAVKVAPVPADAAATGQITCKPWLLVSVEYLRAYRSHAIPLTHETIQSLLSLPWEGMVSRISAMLADLRIEKGISSVLSSSSSIISNPAEGFYPLQRGYSANEKAEYVCAVQARVVNSNLAVSLPPFDITYCLLYACLEMKDTLLINLDLEGLLDDWVKLFDASSLSSAYRSLLQDPGWDCSKFMVYFNNDLSTATDITSYSEIIRDLVSLWVVYKCKAIDLLVVDRAFLPKPPALASPASPAMMPMSPRNDFDIGHVAMEIHCISAFKHLPLQVTESQSSAERLSEMLDCQLAKRIDNLCGVLHFDLLLYVSMQRQMIFSTNLMMRMTADLLNIALDATAIPIQVSRSSKEKAAKEVPKPPKRLLACMLEQSVDMSVLEWLRIFNNMLAAYRLPKGMAVCVFLHILKVLISNQPACSLALLTQHFYPCVDFWLFKLCVFEQIQPPLVPDAALQAYYQYLTQLLRVGIYTWKSGEHMTDNSCSGHRTIVNEWLEVALYLHTSSLATGPYISCVKSIIHGAQRKEDCAFDLPDAMAVCLRFDFFEGFFDLTKNYLLQHAQLATAAWIWLAQCMVQCFKGVMTKFTAENCNAGDLQEYLLLVKRCQHSLRSSFAVQSSPDGVLAVLLIKPMVLFLEERSPLTQLPARRLSSLLLESFGLQKGFQILSQLPLLANLLDPAFFVYS